MAPRTRRTPAPKAAKKAAATAAVKTHQKNPAAVSLGSLGGRVRSPAKAEASRRNGLKGGRPKGKKAAA